MALQFAKSVCKTSSVLQQNARFGAVRCMSSVPEMPPCDFKPDKYTGITYERTQEVRKANLNPALFTFYKKPVMIHQGHMQYLYDTEGTRYLDMFAGIVTISVGHCHPKVIKSAKKQLDKLWHTTNIYLHPTIHEYAEKLAEKLPGDLKVVYFTNSGSESNDLALHMARLYTGVYDTLSLRNGYHGASPYLMGLTAMSTWRYNTPTGFGIHQSMCPDVYRGPWGGSNCRDSLGQTDRPCSCAEGQCEAKDKYIEQLKDTIRFSMPKDKLGAFFIESIQGVGGTVQFPKGFVKEAFDLVRSKGGVCISDEVQCGFGRLGTHYWGFESHGVVPDIVTMAKGMGNGFPIGAVVTTPKIAQVMGNALHFNTFGGNPLSCAVGISVIEVIDEEHIQEKANIMGKHLIEKMLKLKEDFDIVGDVRGKGLMLGMEMVTDKKSKEPMAAPAIAEIWENTKNMGLLLGKGGIYGNVFRIKPPMCITEEDVDYAMAVMRKAFEDYLNANN